MTRRWLIGFAAACSLQGTAAAADLSRESLAVRSHIADRLDIAIEDVEVLQLGLGQALPCGPEAEFMVRSSPGENFRRHADLWISGVEAGESCGSFRVRSSLRVYLSVPVARTLTRAGNAVELTEARLSLEEIDGLPVELGSGTWEARVDLAAGQAVTTNRVRLMPDSRSGEIVIIEAGSGGLRVSASGRMLENGRVGETVRVSNLATDKVVHGVLVAPGKVRAGGEE